MNKLIEQINKVINKKGSLKTPAYYIKGLFIDIVNYFENSINSLKKEIKSINNITTKINETIKNSPKGVVYAGYSNGSIDIKDIYRTHFILSNDPKYSSWVVIYSIKQIKQIMVYNNGNLYNVDITEYKPYNNLFIYTFNLYQIFTNATLDYWLVQHSINVRYNDNIEETIQLLNESLFSIITGGIILKSSSDDNKFIQLYSGNYVEVNIDVPKDTTNIYDGYSVTNNHGEFIVLLNNHNVLNDYTKETENDKITIKIIKP